MKTTTTHSITVIATLVTLLSGFAAYGTITYSNVIIGDNPILYLRLDEANTASGTAATNYGSLGSVANGYYNASAGSNVLSGCPGPITNPSAADNGHLCAGFRGLGATTACSNQVVVPYSAALGGPVFSIEAWAKCNKTNSGTYTSVMAEQITSSHGYELYASGNSGSWDWQWWVGNGSGTTTIASTNGGLLSTSWQYLVGTYDGAHAILYVNGTAVAAQALTYGTNSSQPMQIGAANTTNKTYYLFSTNIAEVAKYNYSLSGLQIANHYAAATGNNPPAIYAPSIAFFGPLFQTNFLGQSASVSVSALGSFPLTYQWYYATNTTALSSNAIPNATNYYYTIASLASTNQGAYWVTLSNSLGTYTSSTDAWVQVINIQSPTINTNPESEIIFAGGAAHFSVSASGAAVYTYQWLYGTNSSYVTNIIANGTNQVLVVPNVQATNVGYYEVQVGDAAGTNTSTVASLNILAAPAGNTYPGTVMSDQPVSYWRLGTVDYTNGQTVAYDLAGGFNGTYYGGVTEGQSGAISGDTDYSSTFGLGSTYVDVPLATNLNSQSFTVEMWVNDNGQAWTYYRAPLAQHDPVGIKGYNFYGTPGNNWAFWLGNGSSWNSVSGPLVQTDTWTHLVATYNGSTATLYVNGVAVGTTSLANYSPNAADDLLLGSGSGGGVEEYFWNGGIDEVAIYNTALSASRIAAHYNMGAGNVAPSITVQPYGGSVMVGSNITLSVTASGTAPLIYQWLQSGSKLSGQTNSTLPLTDFTSTSPVSYDVIVSNLVGSVTSLVVYVTGITNGTAYANLVLGDGAVGFWPLSEPGGTTANNLGSSGSTDNGAYSASVLLGYPGPLVVGSNTSAYFDSTNQPEANAPYDVLLNGNIFTVEAWAQMLAAGTNSADEGYQAVYACRDYNIDGGFTIYGKYNANWVVFSGNGSAINSVDSGVPVVLGQWTHLALTYDGATERFYVNGVQAFANETGYVPNQLDSLQERIGAGDTESTPGAYFFDGNIADVAAYDTCLPVSSIQAHYTIGTTTNSVAPSSPPQISMSLAGQQIILTWSNATALVQCTNLVSPNWIVVTGAVSPMSWGLTNTTMFFRARQ